MKLAKEQGIPFTKYDKIWLEETYKLINENKRPSYRYLRAKLYKVLPRDYNPENIDIRLARFRGEDITLLGVDLIDPKLDIINKANHVIEAIKQLLIDDPEKSQVSIDEIVMAVKINKRDISLVLRLISYYGNFWTSASGNNEFQYGYSSIGFQNENGIFDQYLYFTDIRDIIKQYNIKSQKTEGLHKIPYAAQSEPMHSRETKIHSIFKSRIDWVDKNLCFVLMPFKEPWSDEIYDLIKVTIESLGLQCLRADNLHGPIIIEDIWTKINQAGLIIADVTNRNSNVMYEVGIAHTLDRPTILLTQNIKEVPFDFTHLRHIEYRNSTSGASELKEKLKAKISEFNKPVDNPHSFTKTVGIKGSRLSNKLIGRR